MPIIVLVVLGNPGPTETFIVLPETLITASLGNCARLNELNWLTILEMKDL